MQAAEVIRDSRGGRMEVCPSGCPGNGAHYRFEWFLAPGASGLPEHFHPHQQERLQVVSGRLVVQLEGRTVVLVPGDRIVIPPGVFHRCGGEVGSQTHVRCEFVPGLDIHRFFRRYFAVERSRRGLGRAVAWARLCLEEPEHIGLRTRLRIAFRLLSALGTRLAGPVQTRS
jgi:hypothetical protein